MRQRLCPVEYRTCQTTARPPARSAAEPFPWPHRGRAAVSLAYDDAIDTRPASRRSSVPEGLTGEQPIAFVREAAARGAMMNFTFHAVGGDCIAPSKQSHEELLARLTAHRDVVWTDTFMNLMKYVKTQQAARGGSA